MAWLRTGAVTTAPPGGGVDGGAAGAWVGAGEQVWKVSVPSSPFCREPRTALKHKVYFFKVN